MARKTYDDIKTHCVICGDVIAKDRMMRGAVTCTKEHATERRSQLRAMKSEKQCEYCKRPSTPEEREAYNRFRKFERKFSVAGMSRLYDAAVQIRDEVIESLHPGEKLDEIADTEVIEVTVSLVRELIDATAVKL
jgi:hypothetical protein